MPQTCCCLANPVWNHSQDSDPLTRNLQSAMAKQFPLRIAYEKQNHLISKIHLSPPPSTPLTFAMWHGTLRAPNSNDSLGTAPAG